MSCRSFLSRSARKRPYRSPNNSIRLKDKDLNNVATPPISLSLKASRHTVLAGRGGRCCSAGRSCGARRCCGAGQSCARGRGGRFLLLPEKRKSLFKIPHAKQRQYRCVFHCPDQIQTTDQQQIRTQNIGNTGASNEGEVWTTDQIAHKYRKSKCFPLTRLDLHNSPVVNLTQNIGNTGVPNEGSHTNIRNPSVFH